MMAGFSAFTDITFPRCARDLGGILCERPRPSGASILASAECGRYVGSGDPFDQITDFLPRVLAGGRPCVCRGEASEPCYVSQCGPGQTTMPLRELFPRAANPMRDSS